MKAAVLYEVGTPLAIEDLTLLPPKDGEVRVRYVASGVCHSDLHYIKGDRPYPKPVVLGHEGAGYCRGGRAWSELCEGGRPCHSVVRSRMWPLHVLHRRAAKHVRSALQLER